MSDPLSCKVVTPRGDIRFGVDPVLDVVHVSIDRVVFDLFDAPDFVGVLLPPVLSVLRGAVSVIDSRGRSDGDSDDSWTES